MKQQTKTKLELLLLLTLVALVTILGFTSPLKVNADDSIPSTRYDWDTSTYYMRNDTWTVNTELGYKLYTTQSSNGTYLESSDASLSDFQVGIWVYQIDSEGTESNVTTSVVGNVTQSALTNGTLANTTYTHDSIEDLTFDCALKVNLYHRIGAGSWTAKGTFITENLVTNALNNNTWTLSYYLTITNESGTIYYRTYYGNSTCNSRIANIQLAELDPWGTTLYHWGQGDLVQAILSPFTYHLGDMFYGLLVLAFAITSYNRYRDITPVMIIFLLFGGVTGFLSLLIPSVALNVSYVFLGIGVAIMLYKIKEQI